MKQVLAENATNTNTKQDIRVMLWIKNNNVNDNDHSYHCY